MKIFGREPAVLLALVATLLQMSTAVGLPLNTEQQGLLNGLLAAAMGLAVAAKVAHEKLVPALIGFVVAGFSVLSGFGLDIAPETQTALVAVITAGAAFFVRTQVVAPVASSDPAVIVAEPGERIYP